MITEFKSLYDLFEAIPDEQAAIDHFTAIRWKDGEFCPYCGSVRLYHFADKRTHKCGDCRNRFSIKVGTVFEDTKIGMRKWLAAIWLITSHKKGIASTTLARDIKVTQKTAWFMLHRLREAAATPSFNERLKGDVEADTTFVGGKEKNKHASDRKGKTQGGAGKAVVLGIVEREGELRAVHVPNHKAATLQGAVRQHVAEGSAVLTDEDAAFVGLETDYTHLSVNHTAGEYVRLGGFVHTNSIESVWALFKRQVYGIHHWVSAKHLNRYIGEMTWRFNRRTFEEGARVNALIACSSGRLTYKELIA
jgi:transposase-like protein